MTIHIRKNKGRKKIYRYVIENNDVHTRYFCIDESFNYFITSNCKILAFSSIPWTNRFKSFY